MLPDNKFINIWVRYLFLFIRLKVLPLRTFCYLIPQRFKELLRREPRRIVSKHLIFSLPGGYYHKYKYNSITFYGITMWNRRFAKRWKIYSL